MSNYIVATAQEDAKKLRKKGFSYKQIGELIGCSDSTARNLCLFQKPSYTKSIKNHRVIKKFLSYKVEEGGK